MHFYDFQLDERTRVYEIIRDSSYNNRNLTLTIMCQFMYVSARVCERRVMHTMHSYRAYRAYRA